MPSEKGGANILTTLYSFEKYKTNIDDVGRKRRYSRNIPQWCKDDFESKKTTNGDYSASQKSTYHNYAASHHL